MPSCIDGDGEAIIDAAASVVGYVFITGEIGFNGCDESIILGTSRIWITVAIRAAFGLHDAGSCGQVIGDGLAADIDVVGGIQSDTRCQVSIAAAEITHVKVCCTQWVELDNVAIVVRIVQSQIESAAIGQRVYATGTAAEICGKRFSYD